MTSNVPDVLPAIYTNVAGEVIGGIVSELYHLGPVLRCQLIVRGNNDVYLMRTATSRYVARLSHHQVRGPSDVAYETALLAFLKAAGAPVAAAIAAGTGARLAGVAPKRLRPFAVSAAAAGKRPASTRPTQRLRSDDGEDLPRQLRLRRGARFEARTWTHLRQRCGCGSKCGN